MAVGLCSLKLLRDAGLRVAGFTRAQTAKTPRLTTQNTETTAPIAATRSMINKKTQPGISSVVSSSRCIVCCGYGRPPRVIAVPALVSRYG